jgi:hypothetical protein
MKGDFSRLTFDPAKRYDSVRMQQGRVQVDADWNEQVDIATYHREQALADIIGGCCAPEGEAGYAITANGGDLDIGVGRVYVGGILCEQLDPDLSYLDQPDFPGASLPDASGTYLAYLDVWKWHVTALEDPAIRETALGGRDTATRLKTVCQVKLQPVRRRTPTACAWCRPPPAIRAWRTISTASRSTSAACSVSTRLHSSGRATMPPSSPTG